MNTAPPTDGTDRPASMPSNRTLIAALRAVLPRYQPIATHTQQDCAESQANALLRTYGVTAPPVPDDVIASIPMVEVDYVRGLPVHGAAAWLGGRWLISIADEDDRPRQRFTLAHEFKHILDHRDFDLLHHERSAISAQDHAESLADYFAMCLLMPREWITTAWQAGEPTTDDLAQQFEVTPKLMTRRLWHLGLDVCGPTCHSFPPTTYRRPPKHDQGEP